MLTPEQMKLVQSTLPAVQKHGEEITRVFYADLLSEHPELRSMFSAEDQNSGVQAKRLAAAILAYVGHLDRLNMLGPAVNKISHRHADVNVLPEQYPIVGHHLLVAIKKVLGDAASPEILEAWGVAYNQLADIMIAREKEIYAERGQERELALV